MSHTQRLFILLIAGVLQMPAQDVSFGSPYTAMLRNAVNTQAVNPGKTSNTVFQVSTLDALLQGIYSGLTPSDN